MVGRILVDLFLANSVPFTGPAMESDFPSFQWLTGCLRGRLLV
jgi:hypothetical protein